MSKSALRKLSVWFVIALLAGWYASRGGSPVVTIGPPVPCPPPGICNPAP